MAFQESIPTVRAAYNVDPSVLGSLVQNMKLVQAASKPKESSGPNITRCSHNLRPVLEPPTKPPPSTRHGDVLEIIWQAHRSPYQIPTHPVLGALVQCLYQISPRFTGK